MGSASTQLPLDLQTMQRWHRVTPRNGQPAYFIAILPGFEIAQKATLIADGLHREHAFYRGPRPAGLLHLTTCGIGGYEESPEEIAVAISEAIKDIHMEPFTLVLDCLMTYDTPTKHVVLCGEKGQTQFRLLHIKLVKALRLAGFYAALDCGCQPHMTLFYRGKDIGKRRLPDPFVIQASQIFLVQSHIGEGRHDHFGPWPLH
jgi:2'-5' RNA ligase